MHLVELYVIRHDGGEAEMMVDKRDKTRKKTTLI